MTDVLVFAENLSQSFIEDSYVLKNLNFKLSSYQMIGLVGPDGAGKTTLLRLIATLLLPTQGSIKVLGYNTIQDAAQISLLSSYMPQKFGLYEELSVYQNLDLYAELRELEKDKREEVFEKLLRFTHLKPFLTRKAGDLSGGMKQKLGLACALVRQPKLLILDEPSVGVDPISRRELWEMVRPLTKEGVSVLWSTTYLDEAEKCDEILLLNQGELLYQGPPSQFTKRVEGRVFQIPDLSHQKREHLVLLEERKDVVDVLIQGASLRVVAKTNTFPEGEPISPRLEDAFIDILGGSLKGDFNLSKAAPISEKKEGEVVVAQNLVKQFGSFKAVGGISFSIQRGEIFGLLGPNGAGKSTTFKMLCGLLTPTNGKAIVNGKDLQKFPVEARSKVGYMAQKFSLYGNLSVQQNLEFFSNAYSSKNSVLEILNLFDLTSYASISAEELPLGYKQRLALAVAVLHWPEVLFLDEPTSGMDPVSRREFWSQMNGLVRKGKTILVSTHFMDEAENCDRIALIYKGLIIHLDTPDGLKNLAKSENNQNPSLEDAFAKLIQEYDAAHS
jgi:ABC-2 type transport system ATP-binding protein